MNYPAKRFLTVLMLAIGLSAGLTACFPVIVGSAVATGLIATDRRTSGTQLEDEGIELRAGSRIGEALSSRAHVNVTSYNRRVLLTGEVPSAQDRQLAEQITSRVENVRAVINELAVLSNSSLIQRSGDALITARVKANLIDTKDLISNAYKVVTERATVYLLGLVTKREADRATEVVRATSGVTRVVRLFEIVSEDDLRNMLPRKSESNTKAEK